MTKLYSILFIALTFVGSLYAEISASDYQSQVLNDCDAIQTQLGDILTLIDLSNTRVYECIGVAGNSSLTDNKLREAYAWGVSAYNSLNSFDYYITSLKSTAESLDVSSPSSASTNDYFSILNDINTALGLTRISVDSILSLISSSSGDSSSTNSIDLSFIETTLNDVSNTLTSVQLKVDDINDKFTEFTEASYTYYGTVTNIIGALVNVVTNIPTKSKTYGYISNSHVLNWANNRFSDSIFHLSDTYYSTGNQLIKGGILGNLIQLNQVLWPHLSSLNNYAYTNLDLSISTYKSINSITGSIDRLSSVVTNSFSIFNVDSPLSIHNGETDYYTFLTNYYIRVSNGSTAGSASEPHTNWFSRIEMLLAALVFRNDGSNFVYDVDHQQEINAVQSSLESSLDSVTEAVALPPGLEETIRNTGKSFLDVLEGFHDSISGNSLPSNFTLVDINVGGGGSRSRSGDSTGDFSGKLTLSTPVEGSFARFLNVCHAVTTICFTMLFVFLSIKFVVFFCSKIAKLISVCFHVFASLIGSS